MNSFAPINPALIDVPPVPGPDGHTGYPDALKAQDTRDALVDCCGAASRDFPQSMWVEPKDWADKARDNDKYKTWGMNYLDRYTMQNPTHECTCHSLRANFEAARNLQLGISHPHEELGVIVGSHRELAIDGHVVSGVLTRLGDVAKRHLMLTVREELEAAGEAQPVTQRRQMGAAANLLP